LVPWLERDNSLAWIWQEKTGFPVQALPRSATTQMDIDTPFDVLALARHPAIHPHLKAFLNQLGYSPGPIDGLWGPKTQAAWLKFAADNGLDTQQITSTLWSDIEAGKVDTYVAGTSTSVSVFDTYGSDGGTGTTVTNSPGVTDDYALDASEEQRVREKFPSFAYLLDVPEVGDLLRRAVAEGYDYVFDKSGDIATFMWHFEVSIDVDGRLLERYALAAQDDIGWTDGVVTATCRGLPRYRVSSP